ncbi:hypothetical protein Tco_1099054, partial [Tanacetum coccineum]
METRNSTKLKKILDTMEADKREMAQQMKAMQDQIQELLLSQTHREDSNSHGSVNKGGSSGWHSNDIKVDIPEYDGKLDTDEFMEWIRIVELVFDYKETTDDNKVKIVALKLRKGYDFGVETCDDQVRTSDPDEEVVGPDAGELLGVWRALSCTPVGEEKLQREAIFHT